MTLRIRGDLEAFNDAATSIALMLGTVRGAVTCGALELRAASFAGAYAISCSSLVIDESSWVAAKTAGVTFTVSGATTYLWRGQLLSWGALSNTTGQFIPEGTRTTASTSDATEFHVQRYFPVPRRVLNLRGYVGTSGTLTVRKNGADTTLTVSSAGAFVMDTTHVVDFAVGDAISIGLSGTVAGNSYATVEVL